MTATQTASITIMSDQGHRGEKAEGDIRIVTEKIINPHLVKEAAAARRIMELLRIAMSYSKDFPWK
jgi:hypothetical protein